MDCKWQHSGDLVWDVTQHQLALLSPVLFDRNSQLYGCVPARCHHHLSPPQYSLSLQLCSFVAGATIEVPIFRVQKRSGIQLGLRAQRRSTIVIGSIRPLSRLCGPCWSHITQITALVEPKSLLQVIEHGYIDQGRTLSRESSTVYPPPTDRHQTDMILLLHISAQDIIGHQTETEFEMM